MRIMELSPGPHEVAVARVPAGVTVVIPSGMRLAPRHGESVTFVAVPGSDLGWGAAVCSWGAANGIALNHHKRDRAVWQRAARMLGCAAGLTVLFVVHEQHDWYGKAVWAAVRIREEGDRENGGDCAIPDVIEGAIAPEDIARANLRAAGFPVQSAAEDRAGREQNERWIDEFIAASRAEDGRP